MIGRNFESDRGNYKMDKLSHYREVIKKILIEYDRWVSGSYNQKSEGCLLFDETSDQYLWLYMGWQGKKRVKGINIHLRIKNEKIGIEEDWTENGIATELLSAGVPKEDKISY